MIKRITSPVSYPCKTIYDYWTSKCSDGRLPTRRQIDPGELRDILPYIAMVDVMGHGKDFKVRLIGSEVQRYVGHNCTEEMVSSGTAFEKEIFEPWFTSLIKDKAPMMGAFDSNKESVSLSHEREIISLPLMDADNADVDIIISVIVRSNHWAKRPPQLKRTSADAPLDTAGRNSSALHRLH